MFTINLLKVEKVSDNTLNKTACYFIAAIVPVVAIAAIAVVFIGSTVVQASQRRQIAKYDRSLVELSDAVKLQKEFNSEKESITKSLLELSMPLDKYIQWSPILIEVVRTMPDSMIITELQVKKADVARKTAEGKTFKVIENTLFLRLSGNSQHNYDGDVREYGDRLRSSDALKGFGLEQITVSQKMEHLDKQEVTSYDIKCIFVTN